MSATALQLPVPTGNHLILENVSWRMYTRLLLVFEKRPWIRLTYDNGSLEIMSPTYQHDDDSYLLSRLVVVATEELDLPVRPVGTVTMRRQLIKKGIEADQSIWIQNAPRMRGKRKLDLDVDPPPDLCIEVDVTHSSLDRLGIYAHLRVPEIWHLDGDSLRFLVLDEKGEYQEATHSKAIPLLTPDLLLQFLRQSREGGDQNPMVRGFRKWLQEARK